MKHIARDFVTICFKFQSAPITTLEQALQHIDQLSQENEALSFQAGEHRQEKEDWQRERERMRSEMHKLRREIEWLDNLLMVDNKVLSATQKVVLRHLTRELESHAADARGYRQINVRQMYHEGNCAGSGYNTYLRSIERFKKLGIISKRRIKVALSEDKYNTHMFIKTNELLAYPSFYSAGSADQLRNHGGEREQSRNQECEQDTCTYCGSANLDSYTWQHCNNCGQDHYIPIKLQPLSLQPLSPTTDSGITNLVNSNLHSNIPNQVDDSYDDFSNADNLQEPPEPPCVAEALDILQADELKAPEECAFLEQELSQIDDARDNQEVLDAVRICGVDDGQTVARVLENLDAMEHVILAYGKAQNYPLLVVDGEQLLEEGSHNWKALVYQAGYRQKRLIVYRYLLQLEERRE